MMPTSQTNATTMSTGVSAFSSRSRSSSPTADSIFRISTPTTPNPTSEPAILPPVPIKRHLFSMDEHEDNYMSFPVFPSLDQDEVMEDEESSTFSAPLRPRVMTDEDLLLSTPTQSLESPLSVLDLFEIPRIALKPSRVAYDADDCQDMEIGTIDENLPPTILPALPLLNPQDSCMEDCSASKTPLRIKLSHTRRNSFTSIAA